MGIDYGTTIWEWIRGSLYGNRLGDHYMGID